MILNIPPYKTHCLRNFPTFNVPTCNLPESNQAKREGMMTADQSLCRREPLHVRVRLLFRPPEIVVHLLREPALRTPPERF